jgi:hypothetical protein
VIQKVLDINQLLVDMLHSYGLYQPFRHKSIYALNDYTLIISGIGNVKCLGLVIATQLTFPSSVGFLKTTSGANVNEYPP